MVVVVISGDDVTAADEIIGCNGALAGAVGPDVESGEGRMVICSEMPLRYVGKMTFKASTQLSM